MTGRCPRCFLPQGAGGLELCLCAELPRVDNRTPVLLVRHVNEAWKTSNTARLLALALGRVELVPYGDKARTFEARLPLPAGAAVLYPDGPPTPPGAPPPSLLVVLDGSWSQARRMLQRHPAFQRLPRFSLPPPAPGTFRLRQPPLSEGMSTLEAVAWALHRLEGPQVAEPLLALHALSAERGLRARGVWPGPPDCPA
jgi:DTW domain-containing protein YfiP